MQKILQKYKIQTYKIPKIQKENTTHNTRK